MASGEVPESLKGKRLISIDLSSIMAGVSPLSARATEDGGANSEGYTDRRSRKLRRQDERVDQGPRGSRRRRRLHRRDSPVSAGAVCGGRRGVDEDHFHRILNLGKAEGSLDASNMLKPALARGLQIAGATTLNEYRQSIEKDAALTRRFQVRPLASSPQMWCTHL